MQKTSRRVGNALSIGLVASLSVFLVAFDRGDKILLSRSIQSRMSPDFTREMNESGDNFDVRVPKGTVGRVLKRMPFQSGNIGYQIEVTMGNRGVKRRVWVYYETRKHNPDLRLYAVNPRVKSAPQVKPQEAKHVETVRETPGVVEPRNAEATVQASAVGRDGVPVPGARGTQSGMSVASAKPAGSPAGGNPPPPAGNDAKGALAGANGAAPVLPPQSPEAAAAASLAGANAEIPSQFAKLPAAMEGMNRYDKNSLKIGEYAADGHNIPDSRIDLAAAVKCSDELEDVVKPERRYPKGMIFVLAPWQGELGALQVTANRGSSFYFELRPGPSGRYDQFEGSYDTDEKNREGMRDLQSKKAGMYHVELAEPNPPTKMRFFVAKYLRDRMTMAAQIPAAKLDRTALGQALASCSKIPGDPETAALATKLRRQVETPVESGPGAGEQQANPGS